MKQIKIPIEDSLWSSFLIAYPAHGERTALLRRAIRSLVLFEQEYNDSIKERLKITWKKHKVAEEEANHE